MTVTSVQRSAGLAAVLLLTAGLILTQALIGGRGLLFAYPGYVLIGGAALLALVLRSASTARLDRWCLYAAAIFIGYILLRGLASPVYFARADLFTALGALVVYALVATVFTSTGVRVGICAALLAVALLHVLIGVVQFSRGDNFMPFSFLQRADYGQRASGFYVCPNHLAGLLEVVAIFGVSLTCWSRWPLWGKLLVGYATGACYVGIALTGSRGGYLSVMASLLTFGVLSLLLLRVARRDQWLKLATAGVIGVAALVIAAVIVISQSSFLTERSANIIDLKNVRTVLWGAALQQWELQPIFGTGSGTYRFYGREFRTREMQNDPVDVHNDYLHLLCEYGLIGGVAFLLFFGAHARQGWRALSALRARSRDRGGHLLSNRAALQLGAFSAIAAYVVHSAVDFNLHIPANALLLAFVFALIANPGSSASVRREPVLPPILRFAPAALGVVLLIQSARYSPGEYYAELARIALRDEQPAACIDHAKTALRYERNNPDIYFYVGRASVAIAHQSANSAEQARQYENAVAAYREAQRLAPLDGTYPLNLAYTYDEMGRFEEAEQMFALARARDPHSAAVAQLYHAHLQLAGNASGQSLGSL